MDRNIGLKITAVPVIDQAAYKNATEQYQKMLKATPSTLTIKFNADTKQLEFARKTIQQLQKDISSSTAGNAEIPHLSDKLSTQASNHLRNIKDLESAYVNLKARIQEVNSTMTGAAKTASLKAIQKDLTNITKQMKATFSKAELSNFEDIFGKLSNDTTGFVTNVTKASSTITGLEQRIVELRGAGETLVRVKQQLGQNGWEIVSVRAVDNIKSLTTQINKLKQNLTVLQKGVGQDSSTGQQASKLIGELNRINVYAPEARQRVDQLSTAVKELQQAYANSTQALQIYKARTKEITDLQIQLNAEELKGRNANDALVQSLKSQIAIKKEEAKVAKERIINEKEMKEASNTLTQEMSRQTSVIQKQEQAWKRKNSLISNFADGMRDAVARVANYTLAYKALWMLEAAFRDAIEQAIELNEAFTSIQMVTMQTNEATAELADTYADLAYELSTTVTDIAEGADEWLLIRSCKTPLIAGSSLETNCYNVKPEMVCA